MAKIRSSCCARNSGVTSIIPETPDVFWAVSAVMAVMAYTLFAVIVFISACIPAPPLGSLPAIHNAVLIKYSFRDTLVLYSGRQVVPPSCRCLII